MPRIRTIKPEFWDSPSTAKASPWARLLYIAMWNWADDFGRGTANLKELEGFAFPNDDKFTDCSGNTVHFRDLVAEVSECFGVVFYTVDERHFYEIQGWDKHQRNERRAKQSRFPSPQVSEAVAEIPCKRTEAPRSSGPGTGEQGNRGTGEQVSIAQIADAFERFWEIYPRKVGKKHAKDKFTSATKRADAETIIAGAQRFASDPNLPETQFVPHPSTWLNRDGWEDEPLPSRVTTRGKGEENFAILSDFVHRNANRKAIS